MRSSCEEGPGRSALKSAYHDLHAALKLLWFAIGIETVRCENAVQVALHAAKGALVSGVFGAGKTRSAAVLLAGLLVFDPSLELMVLTKENIAAHAVAEQCPCRCLISSKKRWGAWLDTMNRTAKAHTPCWTSFPPTGTRSSDKSYSLMDAAVGFNRMQSPI